MRRLAILGASGHGKVVADTAERCGWRSLVFFDDAWPQRQRNGPWPVIGNGAALFDALAGFDGVLVAIGDNRIRQDRLRRLRDTGATLATLIHPAATVSAHARIGAGSVIFAGAVLNVDAQVGVGAILNTGSTVDHDCRLGEAVHVSPGANLAGGVQVGDLSWIGIGASVRQSLCIGRRSMVGAGAVVVTDVPDGCTVIGVPARPV